MAPVLCVICGRLLGHEDPTAFAYPTRCAECTTKMAEQYAGSEAEIEAFCNGAGFGPQEWR